MKEDKFSIDEILNDVKRLTGEEPESGKLWSLAEIDALLADAKQEETDEAALSEEPQEDSTESGVGLIDFAINNVIDGSQTRDEAVAAPQAKDEEEPEADKTDSYSDAGFDEPVESFIDEFSDSGDKAIEPLLDSVDSVEETADDEAEQEDVVPEVPGQISIEKTRVFNEINPRSEKKEGIDHQIGVNKIIRTGEIPLKNGLEQDPYRERFFNKPELSIEKTQEHRDLMKDMPSKTIEKTGVIIKKSSVEKTGEDGLSPIPTLVDPADEYDAQQRLEMETQVGALRADELKDDNQIMLEGFGEEDEVEIVSEEQTEENLRKIRRERAKSFKLFPNLVTDEDGEAQEDETDFEKTRPVILDNGEPSDTQSDEELAQPDGVSASGKKDIKKESVRVAREFFGPKDAHAVYDIFIREKSRNKLKLIACAVALGILLLGVITTSYMDSFVLFGSSPAIYAAVNAVMLLAVGAFNAEAFSDAVRKAKKKKMNSNTAIVLAIAVALIQCLVSLAFSDMILEGIHLYSAVAVFAVLMINIADYIKIENDLENFLLINDRQNDFYAVRKVDDEETAFEIGRGLMIKEPDVRYSSKVGFPYKFVEMSKTVDPTAETYRLVLPVAALAALVVGLFSWLINSSVFVGVTSFTGVFLMAVPVAVGLSLYSLLKHSNRVLNEDGGLISGFEAVENSLEANAVAVDAADLFSDGKANIYGIKLFNSMRIDEAILYTAAVVIQSNGALSDVFESIILSNEDMLPAVESLAYEEKLGCSGWIYNYRVLVGNRDLLIKHNVEVQSKQEEQKYTKSGGQALYLAVEGKVSAMFVVGYGADAELSKYLRGLEKCGVNILVRTTDPNVTEELVEQSFSLPRNYVKVISPVAGVMFNEISEKEAENEPCRILHNGSIKAFLSSFVTALFLNERIKIGTVLQYIGVGMGILLMTMFSFTSGLKQAGVIPMILFETIWSAVVIAVPRIKR